MLEGSLEKKFPTAVKHVVVRQSHNFQVCMLQSFWDLITVPKSENELNVYFFKGTGFPVPFKCLLNTNGLDPPYVFL